MLNSIMKISWRNNLLILWYKFFRSKANAKNLVRIGKEGKGISNILFLLPAEKKFAQIASHFIKSDMKNDVKKVKYLVHEDGIQFYTDKIKSDTMTYSDGDFNYIGVLTNFELINDIKMLKFEAIVDLNQSEEQTISFVSLELDIPIKIGYKSIFSDHLYSIVIKPSSIGFLEKNYEIIEKILGLK